MIDWNSVAKKQSLPKSKKVSPVGAPLPTPKPNTVSGGIDWSMTAAAQQTMSPTTAANLSKIGELLQRGSEAGTSARVRGLGTGFQTLLHGESPEQYQADSAEIARGSTGMGLPLLGAFSTLTGIGNIPIKQPLSKQEYAALPGWERAIVEGEVQTAYDPMTYIGGSGALEKIGAEVGPRLAAQVAKRAPETIYAALVHKGAAVRDIYKALPPKKAQQVIAYLEQAERSLSNEDIELMRSSSRNVDQIRRAGAYAVHGLKRDEKAAVNEAIGKYFAPEEKGEAGTVGRAGQQLGETAKAIQAVTNIPYFFNPTRHMANIASLAALQDPIGALQAIGRKIGAGFSADIKRANTAMIETGRARGLTSTAVERELPGWMQKAGPLSKAYNWSQQTLWGFDDLTRNVLIQREQKRLIAQGMRSSAAEATAAHNVNRALVDYTMRSPATKGLYYVAPFATFRTKIPGAVVRSVMKHPERAAIADRLTQGFATGGTQGSGADQGKSYLPAAEVFRALSGKKGAADYLRSTLSWPIKDLLSAGISAVEPRGGSRFFTYGSPVLGKLGPGTPRRKRGVLPSQIFGAIPGADQVLSRTGFSPFEPNSLQNELLQQLGNRLP